MKKIHPQLIPPSGKPEYVVLPFDEFKKIISIVEALEDIKAIKKYREDKRAPIPHDKLRRIAKGESPVKVFREHHELSQSDLAREVGVSRQYICQLESKERKGSASVLKKIAVILDVDLEDLILDE